MDVTPAVITDRQLKADTLILNFCFDNHVSPSDLDRLASRLAQMEAVADQRTDTGKQHDHFPRY
ncbi:hypothetical protein [Rahnella aceris]|jgi:hypothetical protein